jgi:hypothetical protein
MGKPKIFISHSPNNSQVAAIISNAIKSNGLDSFSGNDIVSPGDNWSERITTALTEFDIFLFLISKTTTSSRWQSSEIAYAIAAKSQNQDIKIIPILTEKNAEVPFFLKEFVYLDMSDTNNFDKGIENLISVIGKPRHQLFAADTIYNLQIEALKNEKILFKEQIAQSNKLETVHRISRAVASVSLVVASISFIATISIAMVFLHRLAEFLLGVFCSAISIWIWSTVKQYINEKMATKGEKNVAN